MIAYVILPYAHAFLLSFTDATLVNSLAAGPYFDFVTTLFLAFGLVMEFPIVLFALSRVNILTSQRLRASRRYVILGITIFATVATPGGDLVSPFVLGVTMYILFEATTWFIARGRHADAGSGRPWRHRRLRPMSGPGSLDPSDPAAAAGPSPPASTS